MSPKPCASNDNLDALMNDSNDSPGLGLSNPQRGKDSGCRLLSEQTKPDEEEQDPEDEQTEPEEQEPKPDDATATEPMTFLSCHSANAQELTGADGIERIDLAYDYEIRTTEDADLSVSVNVFELDLLKAVADEYNLSSCEFGRRSLRNGRKLTDISSIVGAGSYLGDVVDSINTECVVNVDSIESPNCTPINGYMTAWVSETVRRRLSESDIYSVIENYSNTYATDTVLAVSYIGTRDVPEAQAPIIDKAIQDDGNTEDLVLSSSTMAPGTIAGIAVASVVALLAILALVVKKRRDRKNAEKIATSRNIVNDALFMIDEDEELKVVNDEASNTGSVNTEDYTYDETIAPSGTFESGGPSECDPSDEAGFEVSV